ncbi:U1 small nuclear ribonucleoprotein 70 kDa-like [Acyrthosiphon pisum]|uniref:U1 small nuclear ribonucleoprotein 70 kDa n=1 Tax=Acyrthosiphon pisum TaxID=7029 RepID=A0A8R2A1P1_ACYPI|nr:U1 small nuclear ribonucleoprotein 70 kDa-like [Acyrthosiphon pisum]|eukprot:XP_001947021.1 PREDICTED: U1 small nuclear ribonucleoprotein 70 kDa-like [Acyrthosiphon pisum]
MTQYLPHNLLTLFAPRDPIPYLPPVSKLSHEKKNRGYSGVGSFMDLFEDPKDTPPPTTIETKEDKLERRRREKAEQVAYKLEQEIAAWNPHSDANAVTDPFKTLFVARINYDTSESKLRREFELYGLIKKIVVTRNKIDGKPRGYAFIEYENERDMYSAYKYADGKKIDGRRVLVDVERARTVKGWLPRRLGGGLGGTRRGGPEVNLIHSGREDNERERERYARKMLISYSRTTERNRERDYYDRDGDREREPRRPRSRDHERKHHCSKSGSRKLHICRSRDRGPRDVEYDEVEEVLGSKPRDKDPDRKRKRKRSHSRDCERRKNRKERDHYRRDKSKDRCEKYDKNNSERDDKIHIKEEPVDEYDEYYDEYDNYNSLHDEYDPDKVKKEEPVEENY